MKKTAFVYLFLLCSQFVFAQTQENTFLEHKIFENTWVKAPTHISSDVSIDAPLMGNGDLTMSVGSKNNGLCYYLSKNDFWRLKSKYNLSGLRIVGFVDINIEGINEVSFTAKQSLKNGVTSCVVKRGQQGVQARSWVSATNNIIFIELTSLGGEVKLSVNLAAPANEDAKLKTGIEKDVQWLKRAFVDSVDIKTEVAVALRSFGGGIGSFLLKPGKKVTIALVVESAFKKKEPLKEVLKEVKNLNSNSISLLTKKHDKWWESYWAKSDIYIEDSILMKAYYQGLYTMAACSRDMRFPPGIFGWITNDHPRWNGDYHLNYNFQAPFYALYAANRLAQAEPHDAPLIDFLQRGKWYAKNVTKTRGILFPVGIGPLGIDVTKDCLVGGYQKKGDIESGGLFFGQRSNAAYGLINMAQQWRCTYDKTYGKKIYPFALAVVEFWEDYLKYEEGRYVIYGDAIHEGSGGDKNPVLSLGLVRNAFELIIDLSDNLKVDEERQKKWKEILNKLSQFPTQERKEQQVFRYTEKGVAWWPDNGLGIQHIYPANAINLDSNKDLLAVARNTIKEMNRWQDMNTSNSFFMAAIRVGYEPSIIQNELHKYALHSYPNGFQLNNPHGIENSCTVTNALNEMLCMSAGNVIRLFNGFTTNQTASFKQIRTWGAFLVSANMRKGIISEVKVTSEKGMLCNMVNPWPNKKVLLVRNGKNAETISENKISFKTTMGEGIELKQL